MKMTKKVLFVATEDQGHIMKFHLPYLHEFKKAGYEVHVACGGDQRIPYCDRKISLAIKRNPLRLSNVKAFFQLKKAIDLEGYSLIHCHTPVGGVLGRLASIKARKEGSRVVYTAHGFHFFKGASKFAWAVYYPIEKQLARWTDCLITINKEDYELARTRRFSAKTLVHVHGVGVDLKKYHPVCQAEKLLLRNEYGFKKDAFILTLAADYNKNKNQTLLIQMIDELRKEIPKIKLLLVGEGVLDQEYHALIKALGVEKHVEMLGFRKDVDKLLQLSDVVVSSSYREGLPVFLMEAMATGLPIVASRCRGNRDLVVDGESGFLVELDQQAAFSFAVKRLYAGPSMREEMGERARVLVKPYEQKLVVEEMKKVYGACLA
ncbi:glycosyltransferase family 4 protein [Gottschalkiaceae bacterium SANA]|nr:glycosyltransferase family 4 protein [Gottschalkiaceae bacterium SANA]